jgi:hypothetical protein
MPSNDIDSRKTHKKVFFEIYNRDGFGGRYVYQKRHTRFSESDVPALFALRPYRDHEAHEPEYLFRVDKDGIHIVLLYDGASLPD